MKHARNALLVAIAMAVGMTVIELVLYPLVLREMPTNLMSFNGRFGQFLAQSSKAGVLPHDYILLTGDSYSVGFGDALSAAPAGTRQPYASAHFIAQQLGRDVLSVGQGGWSNVSAALGPALFAEQARLSLRYRMSAPDTLVYYFYEGNDLDDNIRWARLRPKVDLTARSFSEDEIDALIANQIRRDQRWQDVAARWAEANLPATYFMFGAIRELGKTAMGLFGRSARSATSSRLPGSINRALIDGVPQPLPDQLQGPPTWLPDVAWTNAVVTAKRSLKAMGAAFAATPIVVVYVPSPLSTYTIDGDDVGIVRPQSQRGRIEVGSKATMERARDRLRGDICAIARDLGFGFIDATPALSAAGRRKLLHGPRDWNHFNLEGYRVLGLVVADRLAREPRPAPPADCAPTPL